MNVLIKMVLSKWSMRQLSNFLIDVMIREYHSIRPDEILPGHLVEIQFTYSSLPAKGSGYRMMLKLHSICVLDRIVEKVSTNAFINSIELTVVCRIRLQRQPQRKLQSFQSVR